MIYVVIGNLILFLVIIGHYYVNRANAKLYTELLRKKENVLIDHINNYNNFVDSFDNFYQNKTYQASLAFLQLKLYQEELIDVLDPALDTEMIVKLHMHNVEIDNLLKELSFLSKHTIRHGKPERKSIVEQIHFDESKFSKN